MTIREPIIPEGSEASYERFQFAPAFKVGNTIHVSGSIGSNADGSVPEDPVEEFAIAFGNVATALEAAGASLADIVEITSYHTDMPASLGAFMKAKAKVIAEPFPAWTAIGCTALAIPGARVEVKVTAVIDD